jgi:hypothetical protein
VELGVGDDALPFPLPLLVEVLVLVVVGDELLPPLPLPEFPELPFPEPLVVELPLPLPLPLAFPLPPALPLELVVGAVAATVGGSVVLELVVGALLVVELDVEVLVGLPAPTTGTDLVVPAEGTRVGDALEPPVWAVVAAPDRETFAVAADPAEVAGIVVTTSASFARVGT